MLGIGLAVRAGTAARGFDFSGGVMPVGATLARASPGTRRDAAGALVGEAAGVARFDHQALTGDAVTGAGSGAVRGLLIEDAATNTWAHSDDVSAWADVGCAGTTADLLIEDATTGAHYRQASATVTAGETWTLSGLVGEVAGSAKRYLRLRIAGIVAAAQDLVIDAADGAILASGGFVATGTQRVAPNEWMWWATIAVTTTGSASLRAYLNDQFGLTSTTRAGDGAARLRLRGCQAEQGAAATSRIATGAAAVARAADVVTLDWGGRGVADGERAVTYQFDDDSVQVMTTIVAGGVAVVPVLARARVRRVR